MTLRFETRTFYATTATELAMKAKSEHWDAQEINSAEDYIEKTKETYDRGMEKPLELTGETTEERALEMFKELAKVGAWFFDETAMETDTFSTDSDGTTWAKVEVPE